MNNRELFDINTWIVYVESKELNREVFGVFNERVLAARYSHELNNSLNEHAEEYKVFTQGFRMNEVNL